MNLTNLKFPQKTKEPGSSAANGDKKPCERKKKNVCIETKHMIINQMQEQSNEPDYNGNTS
jgi:hypothetical protein